jgi:hypothetical protein
MKKTITFLSILFCTTLVAQNFSLVGGTSFTGTTDGSAHLVDIDGDGDLDFFNTGNQGGSGFQGIAELYTNDGTGNFTLVAGTPFTAVESASAAFADLDGDCDQDLILTGSISGGRIANMYTNDGSGNYTLVTGTPFLDVNVGDVVISDLDGDTDLDVIISGYNTAAEARISVVYKNDGAGNFTIFTVSPAFALANEGDVDVADVDGDGDVDLLITGDDGPGELTKLYINDGTGVFSEDTAASALFTDMRDSDADFADIDGDGDQDLLISGRFSTSDREAYLYTNNGSGVFTLVAGTPFFGGNGGTVDFFDADNDGDDDVLISGYENTAGNRFTRLYSNNGSGVFTEETSEVITGINNADIAIGDVDGNGTKDIIIVGYSTTRITEMYTNSNTSVQITSSTAGFWDETTTWVGGVVPSSINDVVISSNHIVSTRTTGIQAKSIKTIGTSKLQINAENDLTIAKDVITTNSSSIVFVAENAKNMGTLIFGGNSTGCNIIANLRLPSNDNWHLVAAPVQQATINNFITNATTIVTNGSSKYSLASYNAANGAGLKYTYFDSPLPNTTDTFTKGQGYSTKVNNTGDITKPDIQFKGKLNSTDLGYTISDGGNGFNLIGNPFTTYLYANSNADAVNNVLTVNNGILEEATLWFWDNTAGGGTGDFVTKNQSDDAFNIANNQGFFVKAKTGGGSLSFKENMQVHTKTDAFYKTANNRFEVELSMTSSSVERKTAIRYIENTTTNFDSGYDSSLFDGYNSEYDLYTNLVSENTGKKLAIQSLPNSNYENMIVPVGVHATAGSEIIFTAEALNAPNGINVYLEDRVNNIFTRLDEANTTYKTIVLEASTIGRFFIHTTSSALNVETVLLKSVSIYKKDNFTIRITGLSQGKSTVKLFNILGKQVMNSSFKSNGVKDISLPKLAKGVYIVQLQTEAGKLNKKIILE